MKGKSKRKSNKGPAKKYRDGNVNYRLREASRQQQNRDKKRYDQIKITSQNRRRQQAFRDKHKATTADSLPNPYPTQGAQKKAVKR
jgi:hypothetical protein